MQILHARILSLSDRSTSHMIIICAHLGGQSRTQLEVIIEENVILVTGKAKFFLTNF